MKYYLVNSKFDTLADGKVFQKLGQSAYYGAESFTELLTILDKQLINCGGFERDFHSMEINEVSEEEAKGNLSNWNIK